MADLPIPMTMFHWRDSNKDGSWFFSTCHQDEEAEVQETWPAHCDEAMSNMRKGLQCQHGDLRSVQLAARLILSAADSPPALVHVFGLLRA